MFIIVQVFARPWMGAMAFLWVSVMNPHRLAYGFAAGIPFALISALVTLLALMTTKQRRPIPINALVVTYILFFVWMSITAFTSLNPTDIVWEQWVTIIKIHLMVFVTAALVYEKTSINYMVMIIVGSIAYFGVKGGIFTIITGGQYLVWGPPGSVIEGNNELGLALVMIIPLMVYLYTQYQHTFIRLGILFSIVSCMVAVLGTHSRGALLALFAMATLLGIWSKRPVAYLLIIAIVVGISILFMPEEWVDRMETIRSYEGDTSAMSRINTWEMIWRLALDRPVLGGGFRIDNVELYARYLPNGAQTGYAPHSIYFQALGEHGFPGLFLYLALLVFGWRVCQHVKVKLTGIPDLQWAAMLAKMIQVGFIGFVTGGAFLGLLHWDVPYYMLSMALILLRLVPAEQEVSAARFGIPMQPAARPSRIDA
jgi:putative inorganic carbon (hco3(-)) transporter